MSWPDGFTLRASAAHESSDGLHVELTVARRGVVIHWARLNLVSGTMREGVVKKLREIAPETPSRERLETFCRLVAECMRAGVPVVELRPVIEVREPDLIARVAPRGQIAVDFGDGGAGKGYLAICKALAIRTGLRVGPFEPLDSGQVLYADYESTLDDQQGRYARIAAGVAIADPPPLLYRQMVRPLADDVALLRREVAKHRVLAVIVDSLGPACGAEPESADSTIRAMSALRSLQTTSIVIAHVSKTTADAAGPARPYGSVFVRNIARVAWEVRRSEHSDPNELVVACYMRKNNLGPLAPPFGLRFTFHDAAIAVAGTDLGDAPDLMARAGLTPRLLNALGRDAASVQALAQELGANEGLVRSMLHKLKAKNLVTPLPGPKPAQWGLLNRCSA